MQLVDWIIVGGFLMLLAWGAVRSRIYTRSVAAFLAAERCGGRYLIAVADNMAQVGVITLVWFFEINYDVGFTSIWWQLMEGPASILMAISGWVIYRFRQTRAMTLAQFFEMRYSRNFRVFAGIVAFVGGIINFGIFPSVGARFFIALCDLPPYLNVMGITVGMYPLLMYLLLSISLILLFMGGQIAVMVTDFLQGMISNAAFIIIMVFLLLSIGWRRMESVMLSAPSGQSMVNPFDLANEKQFDVWYYVIGVIVLFYGARCWQGTAGYNCCAKNAHEAKMANILAGWRLRVGMLIALILPIGVKTFLHHPDYAEPASVVQAKLDAIEAPTPKAKATLQTQLRTPYTMAEMLPAGLLGLAVVAMLGAFVSTHDTYLHSWGTILVQDVILPFRKKPLSPSMHLWALRLAIFGVAAFIFLFSIYWTHTQYIAMFLALTGAVFVAGAGSVVIGGLYWRRGSTLAAWSAMITGMVLASAGILVKQFDYETLENHASDWPFAGLAWMIVSGDVTGQELTFFTIVAALAVYVTVSLLGPRTEFNMDKLLHRGKYAVERGDDAAAASTRWYEKLGFTSEFSGRDKTITYITLGWPLLWTLIFIAGSAYAVFAKPSDSLWIRYWHVWTWVILAVATAITIWFAIGGMMNLRELFRTLDRKSVDIADDGRVN